MSGGQRQRVAIGRALVRDVNVFLFDEPLSNLDAKLRSDLHVELKRLHRRLGNTMIYVTHDQIEALTLADRIAIMKDGITQQLDTLHGVYQTPTNRFVAGFVGSPGMNFLGGTLKHFNGAWVFETDVDREGRTVSIALDRYAFGDASLEAGQRFDSDQPLHIGFDPARASLFDISSGNHL